MLRSPSKRTCCKYIAGCHTFGSDPLWCPGQSHTPLSVPSKCLSKVGYWMQAFSFWHEALLPAFPAHLPMLRPSQGNTASGPSLAHSTFFSLTFYGCQPPHDSPHLLFYWLSFTGIPPIKVMLFSSAFASVFQKSWADPSHLAFTHKNTFKTNFSTARSKRLISSFHDLLGILST